MKIRGTGGGLRDGGTGEARRIEITEVGPRDDLQIEKTLVAIRTKIEIINAMIAAGVRRIEATSFVAPRAVPQLANAEEVLAGIDRGEPVFITALCMNEKGAERAAKAKLDAIELVCSASKTHQQEECQPLRRGVARRLRDRRRHYTLSRPWRHWGDRDGVQLSARHHGERDRSMS